MRQFVTRTLWSIALCSLLGLSLNAQDKIAQTGFQFLSVVSDARGAALANTMTAIDASSSALFFNPATMANSSTTFDASFSINEWIADINHNNLSLSYTGSQGTVGFALQTVDYGEILGTQVADNDLGYVDTGNIDATAMALGVGYARRITDRFSVGGQIKYVRQNLGRGRVPLTDIYTIERENEASAFAFDFGTNFRTGFRSLVLGITVRNFSEEVEFERESFQLPLTFSFGVSIDVLDFAGMNSEEQSLRLGVQASNARSHPEQVSFGLEYMFNDLIALRGGYVTENDEEDFTFGFGVNALGLGFDYAYTPFGVFDNVQRFSVRIGL